MHQAKQDVSGIHLHRSGARLGGLFGQQLCSLCTTASEYTGSSDHIADREHATDGRKMNEEAQYLALEALPGQQTAEKSQRVDSIVERSVPEYAALRFS